MLDQQFFQNEKFQEFLNSNFILYRASRGEKSGDETFKKFNIRGTPTVMMLGSDGSEVDWHVGYGPPPEKFLERLEKSVKGIDTFKSLSDRYSKDPKNVEVVFKLAQKYNSRYVEEKALELYKKVLALDPAGKKGTTDYNEEKVTYTEYAEYSIGELSAYARKRDPEPLKAFIKKYPESKMLKSAYSRLSSYYMYSGSKEEATAFFEEYTSKYPDEPYVLSSHVSRIIRDKENVERGIELAEKIKDIMKYNPDPSYMKDLADLYMLKEEKEKAEEVFGKRFMEGKVSSLASYLIRYADFWVKHNMNTESAEEMIDVALKLIPETRWFQIQSAASIYLTLKKPDKALEIYGPEFAKKHAGDSDILSSYARFWASQGKNLESALEAAKKAVELYATDSKWDSLSLVYQKLGKYDEALKAAEKAVELADEQMKVRYKSRVDQIKKEMSEKKEKDKLKEKEQK